jgi:dUTP pyrophosphatase
MFASTTDFIFIFHNAGGLDYTSNINDHNNRIKSGGLPDAGFNLFSPSDIEYKKGVLAQTLNTGITGMMVDKNQCPVAFTLEPRSSICKTPLRMSNGRGIIDAGYRGNLLVKCDAFDDFTMERNTSYFQVLSPNLTPFQVKAVDSLDYFSVTDRGAGGFGSTGGN